MTVLGWLLKVLVETGKGFERPFFFSDLLN
jgi:hypothetical protein